MFFRSQPLEAVRDQAPVQELSFNAAVCAAGAIRPMTTIDRNRLNLSVHHTSARQTPPPAARQFAAVVSQGGQALVRAALAVAQHVPGVDAATAALRGAGMPGLDGGSQEIGGNGSSAGAGGADSSMAPLNVGAAGSGAGAGGANGGAGPVGNGGSDGGSVEGPSSTNNAAAAVGASADGDMLTRGQEMSMRMLRLQESMAEENRRYTALSNVMHARHEMAKNAINNIR